MSSAIVILLACLPAAEGVDTVVVAPTSFRQALEPWLAYRREQGHRIAVVSNQGTAPQIRERVRQYAATGELRYVLLVGDADPRLASSDEVRERSLPTHHARAEVNVRFGSEPEIATDNWYADLDDDRVPELAVGRLSADSPAELAQMIRKIMAYETSEDFGRWRTQLHFVAGLGGFGPLSDAMLEATAKGLIAEGVPASHPATMTYASWQSPYCPDPRQFRNVAVERLNEGSLLWIYLGHGEERNVDHVRVPGGAFPILSCRDVPHVACRHGAPIACFLSCYTGSFDQAQDCLAEDLLRQPGGPVAVYCGSRVTMPYGMTVMGSLLLEELFAGRDETIGQVIVAAKRRMAENESGTGQRAAIEAAARALNPSGATLEAERSEHLDLFNLLGDPLLHIPRSQSIELDVEPRAAAGERLAVSGNLPFSGTCTLELVVRRGRLTFQPPRRAAFDPRALGEYDAVYRRANEPRLATRTLELPAGPFATELEVPSTAQGACHVRMFVAGGDRCAAGAAEVRVDPRQGGPAEPRTAKGSAAPAGR